MEFIIQNNDTEKLRRLQAAVKPLLCPQFFTHLQGIDGVTDESIVNFIVSGPAAVGGGVSYSVKLGHLRKLYVVYEDVTL